MAPLHIYLKLCAPFIIYHCFLQVKCPECRAEHRIPYNGVQGFPANVTLQRFLEAHIEITGETPDPHTGQLVSSHSQSLLPLSLLSSCSLHASCATSLSTHLLPPHPSVSSSSSSIIHLSYGHICTYYEDKEINFCPSLALHA